MKCLLKFVTCLKSTTFPGIPRLKLKKLIIIFHTKNFIFVMGFPIERISNAKRIKTFQAFYIPNKIHSKKK